MKRILVVEDDLMIQDLIIEFLSNEGYIVDSANNGAEGVQKFKEKEYDLVLLDVMMPIMDGFSACKIIRSKSNVPIIFLSALNEEFDQIKGYDLDCDDYITKPFSFNILLKKVNAVLKRGSSTANNNVLYYEKLKLDLDTYRVEVDGQYIDLTLTEFNILKCLLKTYPAITTRDYLLDDVWGYDYYGDERTVDAHIKNIRKKMTVSYIKTVKGVGYTLDKNA
ncbi:MAG: response regulator transcription factor [Clostridium sp.]|nr:response regulator transcription factor [Clostridium sp.]